MFPLFMPFLTEKSSNCHVQHFQTFHNFQNCLLLTYKIKNCCPMKIACSVVFFPRIHCNQLKKRKDTKEFLPNHASAVGEMVLG